MKLTVCITDSQAQLPAMFAKGVDASAEHEHVPSIFIIVIAALSTAFLILIIIVLIISCKRKHKVSCLDSLYAVHLK